MFKKKLIAGLAITMMMSAATGCGNNKSDSSTMYLGKNSGNYSDNYAYAAATEAAADYEYYYDDDVAMNESSDEMIYEGAQVPESEDYKGVSSTKSESGDSDSSTTTLDQINTEKLVYHCDLTFDTENYNDSINQLKSLMNQYGAFLEYENERNNSGYGNNSDLHIYNATIRIPVGNYQTFLDSMGNIGDLKNKCQDVQNLSQEYTDLNAELEVLEAKRDSYISMMKEAKTLDDMESLLMIDERLTEVEVSINRIKSRLNNINNDVAYSYITISIVEVREYEAPEPENFGQRVSQAFKDGWKNFKEGCQDFVIWAAENIIGLGIFLAIILIIWFALLRKPVKALRARIRANKASKKAAKAAQTNIAANAVTNEVTTATNTAAENTAAAIADNTATAENTAADTTTDNNTTK